jgi:hypothetical protein
LTPIAAHQTFIEVADDIHDPLEADQLLKITDNIPLAVQLIATVAASEGCQATLERWKLESTAMLSAGYDKRSNLETSIMLSLSSPRMLSLPHAADLLSLMSLLSDGISDTDLAQSRLPIPEILKCKTTLIRTSLAYVDNAGHLKVLAPIREYIQKAQAPPPVLVRPLRTHLIDCLRLWQTAMQYSEPVGHDLAPYLRSNLGNLHNVLLHGLDYDLANLGETTEGIILLNRFHLVMSRGLTSLMLWLPEIQPELNDHRIQGQFITEAFQAKFFHVIPNPNTYMDVAIEHFRIIKDVEGEGELCSFFMHIGQTYDSNPSQLNSTKQWPGVVSSVFVTTRKQEICLAMHSPWHHNAILRTSKFGDLLG